MRVFGVALLGMTFLVAGCGNQDVSGIYVVKSDNEVTLVQLIEDKDHKLTGRIEVNTIGPDAIVTGKTASLDGSVSGNDLILRPASIWLGGIEASGTYSSNSLQLTGKGFNITAERTLLDTYQEAVANLKSVASERREKLAQTNATLRQEEDHIQGERDTAASISTIREAVARITTARDRLNEGINKSPDFAKMASANTTRLGRMLAAAPSMSEVQRGQLGVQANQAIVGTNQIEVSRNQYSIRLNAVVDDAKQAAGPIAKLCGGTPAPRFAAACSEAFTAMNGFKAAMERGQASFSPYKQRVGDEMKRQEELAAKIDG
jgi:hypothetical protein